MLSCKLGRSTTVPQRNQRRTVDYGYNGVTSWAHSGRMIPNTSFLNTTHMPQRRAFGSTHNPLQRAEQHPTAQFTPRPVKTTQSKQADADDFDMVEVFFPELRETLRETPISLLIKKQLPVISIQKDQSVFEAVKIMSSQDKGAILVMNNKDLVGIFTERDYFRKLILEGRSSPSTRVEDVMSEKVITAYPDTSVAECGSLMAENEIRHLPVVGKDGNVVGMVSSKDVMKKMVEVSEAIPDIKAEFESETVGDVFDWLGRDTSLEPFVGQDDTVYHAIEIMDRHNLPGVWVTKGDQLTGIFTERDYLKRVFVQNKHSKETKMKEVMTTDVITVTHHSSLLDTLQLMVKKRIRTLPVVPLLGNEINYGEKDVLVGMITAMDVIKFIHRMEEDSADRNITEL